MVAPGAASSTSPVPEKQGWASLAIVAPTAMTDAYRTGNLDASSGVDPGLSGSNVTINRAQGL